MRVIVVPGIIEDHPRKGEEGGIADVFEGIAIVEGLQWVVDILYSFDAHEFGVLSQGTVTDLYLIQVAVLSRLMW
jgi:hypothetical protein